MKIVAAVFGVFLAVYAAWVLWFSATGVRYIDCSSKDTAFASAYVYKIKHPEIDVDVMPYTGESNTLWSGKVINGFVLVDKSLDYEDIQNRDFVVYNHSRIGLVCHSARVKNLDGTWILEGDGNKGQDNEFLTPDNYVGVMYKKTVWSY